MLALGVYHLLIFFYVRDRSYLYFGFGGISYGLFLLSWAPYSFTTEFLWPSHPVWNYYFCLSNLIVAAVATFQFSKLYLETKVHTPRWHVIVSFQQGVCLILPVVMVLDLTLFFTLIQLVSASMILLLVIAILVARKGYSPAWIYLIVSEFQSLSLKKEQNCT
ncbi:7TM-DISM domain-containing protein, partial [candidate division CSSED10-310 bacterium]